MKDRNWKNQYKNRKAKLLKNKDMCADNRFLLKKFLEEEEYKLKRSNGIEKIDTASYKTLYAYLVRFNNVNKWFNNKPLKELTKAEIKKVYDDLEEGRIKTITGKPYKDKITYYNKVFKSRIFEIAGIKEKAVDVLRYGTFKSEEEVRFIEETTFKEILLSVNKLDRKLLLWLAFDIGENIGALLQLRKRDFHKQIDKDTNMPEYRINLRKEILKRSRKPRSLITNFQETTKLLDLVLSKIENNDDELFNYRYSAAKLWFYRAVKRVNATCLPNGQAVTFKDLRSSMVCYLLSKGWHTDELNSRLGHKPSSREIDRYVNFLALDERKPKRKIEMQNFSDLKKEFKEMQAERKLQKQRYKQLEIKNSNIQKIVFAVLEELNFDIDEQKQQSIKKKIGLR